jgi:hypothetical protein
MIVTIRLPLCDRCGELWLPQKGETRTNPELVNRCGKCKSPNWNRSSRVKLDKENHDRLRGLLRDAGIPIEDSSLPPSIPPQAAPEGRRTVTRKTRS